MDFRNRALETLKQTSRTFYIPIARLPDKLQDAVASAYLCMRAIDEIEDTPDLDNQTKAYLLRNISLRLQEIADISNYKDISADLAPYSSVLPDVSLSIGEWRVLHQNRSPPGFGMLRLQWQIVWLIGQNKTGQLRLKQI